jgi:hypothetical protein
MREQALPGMVSASEHEADLRAREEDNTPRGVARAILSAALPKLAVQDWHPFAKLANGRFDPLKAHRCGGPIRVLDVCAGFGCWASEMRRIAACRAGRCT